MRTFLALVALVFAAQASAATISAKRFGNNFRNLSYSLAETSSAEGTLEILCTVSKTGKATYMYFLKSDDGTRQEVFFDKNVKIPNAGARIKVNKALKLRDSNKKFKGLFVPETEQQVEMLTEPAPAYNALGDKNVLVFLVNYTDKPTANTATVNSYSNIYNTLKTGFWAQSFNSVNINSTIVSDFKTVFNSTHSCDGTFLYNIMDEGKKYAAAQGVDVTKFQHFQMVLPSTSKCGWCGLGSVFGPYTWINACNSYSTVGHELGHNFGMLHGNSFNSCDSNWKNCTNQEYNDGADLMGVAQGEFTSVHKDKSKWFDGVNQPKTQTVKESGIYSIEPLETLTTGIKTLKFERAPGEFYYVEFRQPIGYDKNISGTYHKVLGIHYGAANSTASWRLKNVSLTDSFTDPSFPGGGLSIALASYNASGAQVKVVIGGVVPPTPTPTVVPPTATPTPTVVPTKTPTVVPPTPTVPPPSTIVFKVVPGKTEYQYDPTRTIWSSTSLWITKDGKGISVPVNYKVIRPDNKVVYALNKTTDGAGYVKLGLPIDKNTTPGKYTIKIVATIGGKAVPAPLAYFEVVQ